MNFKKTMFLILLMLLLPVCVFPGQVSVFGLYNSGDDLDGKYTVKIGESSQSADATFKGDKNSMGIGVEYIDSFKSKNEKINSFKYSIGLLLNSSMEYDRYNLNLGGADTTLHDKGSLRYGLMYANLIYELSSKFYLLGGFNISLPKFDDGGPFAYNGTLSNGQIVSTRIELEDEGGLGYQVGAGLSILDNLSAEVVYENINMSPGESGTYSNASTETEFSFNTVRFSVKYLFEYDLFNN